MCILHECEHTAKSVRRNSCEEARNSLGLDVRNVRIRPSLQGSRTVKSDVAGVSLMIVGAIVDYRMLPIASKKESAMRRVELWIIFLNQLPRWDSREVPPPLLDAFYEPSLDDLLNAISLPPSLMLLIYLLLHCCFLAQGWILNRLLDHRIRTIV